MLFNKYIKELTTENVLNFCKEHDEGIRVEYKGDFETSKKQIPKELSAFANTYGGVLICGVEEKNGRCTSFPGCDIPNGEVELTIESLCRAHIYPSIKPVVHTVKLLNKRVLILMYQEESIEAPHAIENSTRVYFREGSAKNPVELTQPAGISKIQELFGRRNEAVQRRNQFINRWHNIKYFGTHKERVSKFIKKKSPIYPTTFFRFDSSPLFVETPTTDRDSLLVWSREYHKYPVPNSIQKKRILEGMAQFTDDSIFAANIYGITYFEKGIHREIIEDGQKYVLHWKRVSEFLNDALDCCEDFYRFTSSNRSLLLKFSAYDFENSALDTTPSGYLTDEYRNIAIEDNYESEYVIDSTKLMEPENKFSILKSIFFDFIWLFMQDDIVDYELWAEDFLNKNKLK